MATLFGDSLKFLSATFDGGSVELDGAFGIATFQSGANTFVYVSGRDGDTIQLFVMDATGGLTPTSAVLDTGLITLRTVREMEVFTAHGKDYLIAIGESDDGMTLFEINPATGVLTAVDAEVDATDPNTNLDNPVGLSVFQADRDNVYIYVSSFFSDGVSSFTVNSSGNLVNQQNFDDVAPTDTLDGSIGNFLFEQGGQTYLAVGSRSDDAVTVFSVDSVTGTLAFETSIISSYLSNVWSGSGVEIGGDAYLYMGSLIDSTITVLKFDGSNLTEESVLNVPSTLLGTRQPKVIEVGDKTYLVALADTSDKLTIFEIETDPLTGQAGRLKPLDTLNDDAGKGALNGAVGAHTVQIGDTNFLLAASFIDDAINVYEIGGLDDTITGTDDDDSIEGGAGDDVIEGLGGNDVIVGGDGDDIIFAGSGDDTVVDNDGNNVIYGGDGNDLLIAGGAGSEIHGGSGDDAIDGSKGDDIITGGDGVDQIDGSAGDDQINAGAGDDIIQVSEGVDSILGGSGTDLVDATGAGGGATGVTIDFLRNEIILADGTVQSVAGVENSIGSSMDDTLVGDDFANVIEGGDGNDVIRGRSGDDDIAGNGGDDFIVGADGDDILGGGFGNDRIAGGNGNDSILGSNGDDRIFGGGGNDAVLGGSDNDLIKGNDGADDLGGNGGDDRIEGNQGDDFLRGNGGNDVLIGGGGRDRLNAGDGTDTMTGGSAIDTFVFDTAAGAGGGLNTITDFQDGLDQLDVAAYGLSAGAVLGLAAQNGSNVDITFADGQIIRLNSFTLSDLDASDLIV